MRKKPDRFGQGDGSPNKDHFFDDESTNHSDSDEYSSGSEIDSSKADKSRDVNSTNILRNQISRVEAKVDDVIDIVKQLQRMIISLNNGSRAVTSISIPDLPLMTKESVEKFDSDLKDQSFRQSVVSNAFQLKMFF